MLNHNEEVVLDLRPHWWYFARPLGLLAAAMAGARTWGFASFSTHTARPSLQRRLLALGAHETGGFVRLVAHASGLT